MKTSIIVTPSLREELQLPVLTHSANYKGEPIEMKWPEGKLLARSGSVFLLRPRRGTNCFVVIYGSQVTGGLSREKAAEEFGQCCFHQAECEGLLDA